MQIIWHGGLGEFSMQGGPTNKQSKEDLLSYDGWLSMNMNRNRDHLGMPAVDGVGHLEQSIADTLKTTSAKVFFSHHYLATQFLEIFTEVNNFWSKKDNRLMNETNEISFFIFEFTKKELGLNRTAISSMLQKLPLRTPGAVSSSMYRYLHPFEFISSHLYKSV